MRTGREGRAGEHDGLTLREGEGEGRKEGMREACPTAVCSRGARGPTLSLRGAPQTPRDSNLPWWPCCPGAWLGAVWPQNDRCDGFQSQLWSITLPMVGDLRDAFAWSPWNSSCALPTVDCCSVAKSCLTLYDPMDCSMSGFPVLHHLPEFAQTLIHWVGDVIQPSYTLSPPSPPALKLSQHQVLF